VATSGIVWRAGQAPSDLTIRVKAFGDRFLAAVLAVGHLIAAEAEAYAQANAPWIDRTGQARQGLRAVALELGATAVAIVLYHQAAHGKWLELCNQGRYAIILPTLVQMYGRVMAAVQAVFGGA